jgi:hypothetical protein
LIELVFPRCPPIGAVKRFENALRVLHDIRSQLSF